MGTKNRAFGELNEERLLAETGDAHADTYEMSLVVAGPGVNNWLRIKACDKPRRR